ncbi:MAG: aspartate aminotransferase family protein [Proteobacteria bacterium]|nr:aspartate aminotransferase family protein [Pseudomonadota bacterium]
MPGGVTRIQPWQSPFPDYAASAAGAYISDVDGARILDFTNCFSAMIHGHGHPEIVAAVGAQLARGSTGLNTPTESEILLAEHLCQRIPGIELIRFCNSGSEAVMHAIKAARAHTGRPTIAKIEGAYHGAYDYAEVSLDSTPENWGNEPSSTAYATGTPQSVLADVVALPFNRPQDAARILRTNAAKLAGVLLDVLPANVGCIPATREFLDVVISTARDIGALIILDEVVSLRLNYHGAQALFAVDPDLTVAAKIIGGGFPVGAVGGKAAVMAVFDHRHGKPLVPQGGTFTANPVTMTAGLAAMRLLTHEAHDHIDRLGERARTGISQIFARHGVAGQVTGMGSIFKIHMHTRPIVDHRSHYASQAERNRLDYFQMELLKRGFLISAKGYGFTSTPMTAADIDGFVSAVDEVVATLCQSSAA